MREEKGYTIKGLAEVMDCSASHITGIELNKKRPSEFFLNDLEQKTGISKSYLKSGDTKHLMHETAAHQQQYKTKQDTEDPLVHMAKEILASGTEYSIALGANIRAYHHALKTEKLLDNHEKRIQELEVRTNVAAADAAATERKET